MSQFEDIQGQAATEDLTLSVTALSDKYGPNGHPTHRLLDWVRTQDVKRLDNPGQSYWLWVRARLAVGARSPG